jgi:uncharacterized membrane protein YfcA
MLADRRRRSPCTTSTQPRDPTAARRRGGDVGARRVTLAIAAVAVLLGAGLQSATGFGFALVSAPVLFALLGPREAVSAGALLSIELSLLTLATERRVPRVLHREAFALVAWSLPGLALGAVALRELPDRVLSVLVAVGVLGALGLRLRGRAAGAGAQDGAAGGVAGGGVRGVAGGGGVAGGSVGGAAGGGAAGGGGGGAAGGGVGGGVGGAAAAIRPASGWHTAAAGVTSGALSTATSLSGPPLVLHLVARGLSPDQMRDTLAAVFVALAVLTAGALLLAGTFEMPSGLVVLVVAGAAGQVIGRRGFAWLSGGRHEDALLAVLAVTAVVALVSSVL